MVSNLEAIRYTKPPNMLPAKAPVREHGCEPEVGIQHAREHGISNRVESSL